MKLERERERGVEEKKSCGARKIKKSSRIIRKENEKIRGMSEGKKIREKGMSEDNKSVRRERKLKDEK